MVLRENAHRASLLAALAFSLYFLALHLDLPADDCHLAHALLAFPLLVVLRETWGLDPAANEDPIALLFHPGAIFCDRQQKHLGRLIRLSHNLS